MRDEISNSLTGVANRIKEHMQFDYSMAEVSELISTSSSIGRLFVTGAQFASQKRFEYFLKGLSNGHKVSSDQLEKLEKYVSNEKRAQFLCEQLDKVVRSNSVRAAMMMGVILNETMKKDLEPSLQQLITINALSHLYDEDIKNLEDIYYHFFHEHNDEITLRQENYDRQMWMKFFQRNDRKINGLEYTFEKLMGLQLFKEEIDSRKAKMLESYGFFEKPEFVLKITPPGKEIIRLIKVTNIY